MIYKCLNCGHTSEQAGNCPTCNVPIVEETVSTGRESAPETSQSQESQMPESSPQE